MHTIKKLFINTLVIYTALWTSVQAVHAFKTPDDKITPSAQTRSVPSQNLSDTHERRIVNTVPVFNYKTIQWKHGDISWLPALAEQAGWPKHTWKRLGHIILRESGGCPNRRGGDAVDKNCNITRVTEWNHRSDTGLLQINGVNYDTTRNKWAAVCTKLDFCQQEQLLDPLNNLKAGKLLWEMSGWDPWNPCTWDPTRCPKNKKVNG